MQKKFCLRVVDREAGRSWNTTLKTEEAPEAILERVKTPENADYSIGTKVSQKNSETRFSLRDLKTAQQLLTSIKKSMENSGCYHEIVCPFMQYLKNSGVAIAPESCSAKADKKTEVKEWKK